jgi:hypothetical protein
MGQEAELAQPEYIWHSTSISNIIRGEIGGSTQLIKEHLHTRMVVFGIWVDQFQKGSGSVVFNFLSQILLFSFSI